MTVEVQKDNELETTNFADEDEVSTFIRENRNKNTAKKTHNDLRVFYRWAKKIKEIRKIEEIPPNELDKLLACFVVKVRKQNGDEFEPDTLTSYFRSIDRFLREQGKQYSILLDREFNRSREALACKRKELRRRGKGQKPIKAQGLSTDHIKILWQKQQLGNSYPQVLLRTVWFYNTVYLGWRAQDEHHRVRYGDFEVKTDGEREYVEWIKERGSKTRTYENEFFPDRPFNPKMFATDGPRCPVKLFKKYISHVPPEMKKTESPFYLAAIQKPSSEIWYKRQPLGKHSMAQFMKEMCKAAGIEGRFTNHSARRTMISTLRKENVEPLNIIALAGQRNLKSLDSYSEASTEQQHVMSSKLSEHIEGRKLTKDSALSPKVPLQLSSTLTSNPLEPAEQPESNQSMFYGAVFNNCSINFGRDHHALAVEPSPSFKKKFKRIDPLNSDDEL
ncbi:uncharacterized protein KIAA1958-like [Actinia tenebrosa]|uniref:Uncharacterized protein KIAA1958-like n=1 Tax=Actinia tenebrosa TaxID=6105 RepID=A0A6P8HJ41_ACTTE|nr:uncharacterized protein KIAA1958-like [Actinia tenebrosa]